MSLFRTAYRRPNNMLTNYNNTVAPTCVAAQSLIPNESQSASALGLIEQLYSIHRQLNICTFYGKPWNPVIGANAVMFNARHEIEMQVTIGKLLTLGDSLLVLRLSPY